MRTSSYANRPKEPTLAFGLDYVQWFRDVFAEVMKVVRAVQRGEALDPAIVREQLLVGLNRQVELRERTLERPPEELRSVRYIMVALADEVLVKLAWESGTPWSQYLLEEAPPFGTHAAGDRVFDDLEAILTGKRQASPELLSVYLLALALGFRGRYAVSTRTVTLEGFRQRIVQRLYQNGLPLLPSELCPSAKQHPWNETGMSELRSRISALRPLLWGFAFIATVVSTGVWWYWIDSEVWWGQDAINAMVGVSDSSTNAKAAGL